MDAGLTIRPIANAQPGTAGGGATAATPVPARQTVATDLPASKSVSAAATDSSIRNDAPRLPDTFTRDLEIRGASHEVVYRLTDDRSHLLLQQVPAEALLRLRVYTRAIADGKSPANAQNQADLEA